MNLRRRERVRCSFTRSQQNSIFVIFSKNSNKMLDLSPESLKIELKLIFMQMRREFGSETDTPCRLIFA